MKNNGTKEEADDIFQDAVMQLFQVVRKGKFDENYEIDAFLYSVARNLWINKVKKDQRMQEWDGQTEKHPESTENNALEGLLTKEKTMAIREVFQALDEKCQKILHLYLNEEKTMKEISQILQYSSEDVAKTNHYRCKQYLIKIIHSQPHYLKLLRP